MRLLRKYHFSGRIAYCKRFKFRGVKNFAIFVMVTFRGGFNFANYSIAT